MEGGGGGGGGGGGCSIAGQSKRSLLVTVLGSCTSAARSTFVLDMQGRGADLNREMGLNSLSKHLHTSLTASQSDLHG